MDNEILPFSSYFEIIPSERGKTYIVKKQFTINYHGKNLTIPEGFIHDSYTFAPNTSDETPAIIHDYAYSSRKWDNGDSISRYEADNMLYFFMRSSKDNDTKSRARLYYYGVRIAGWYSWNFCK